MTDKEIELEVYKNHLLFAIPTKAFGLEIKQFTVKELLSKYYEFDSMRRLIMLDVDNLDEKFLKQFDEHMFDVKDFLAQNYPYGNYDLEYEFFDLIGYVGVIKETFKNVIEYFTHSRVDEIDHIPDLDILRIVCSDNVVICINRSDLKRLMNMLHIANYASNLEKDDSIKKTDAAIEFDKRKAEIEKKLNLGNSKQTITFNSILSWLANDGCTHETLLNRTIYQVMDTFRRKNYIEYCRLINNARSGGMCDIKGKDLDKINNAFCLY